MKALELAVARADADDGDAEYFEEQAAFETEYGDAPRGASSAQDQSGESLFQRQADALLDIAKSYLSGDKHPHSSTSDNYQVTVHVDEKALRGEPDEQSKSDLPIETVRRLCCDGAVIGAIEDDTGAVKNVTRKHRVVH